MVKFASKPHYKKGWGDLEIYRSEAEQHNCYAVTIGDRIARKTWNGYDEHKGDEDVTIQHREKLLRFRTNNADSPGCSISKPEVYRFAGSGITGPGT